MIHRRYPRLLFRIIILLLILVAYALRIPIMKVRFFDPDEFQHLHGARQIYRGEIPYRDYFEHHTPFIGFILSGLYPIFGEEIRILFAARALMLAFTAVILFLIYVLTKTLYKTDAGLLAVLFLSYVIMFLEKTIEIRPDVPAVVLWLTSLILLIKGIQRNSAAFSPMWNFGKVTLNFFQKFNQNLSLRKQELLKLFQSLWFIFSGLAIGIAIMFTQKVLFALNGLVISLIWMLCDPRTGIPRKRSLKLIAIYLGSAMVPIILTCVFFYAKGGLWQFINDNFIMNVQWKVRFSPRNYINRMLGQNPFFPVFGILGLLLATSWFRKREEIAKGGFVPVLCAYALIAGLFIMPVPYRQYYQLFLPLLAMYCGMVFQKLIEVDVRRLISSLRSFNHGHLLFRLTITILAIILVTAGLFYTLHLSKPAVLNSKNLYLVLWIILIVIAVPSFIFNRRVCAVLIISIGIVAYPLNQMVDQLSQKNTDQLNNIKYIMNITSPEDTVLDGWSGYGFLRPHAYFYYFLHSEMRAMLSEKELSDDLIESLEEKQTKVIIYDGDIRALPEKVQEYIEANYASSGHGNIYIRKNKLNLLSAWEWKGIWNA